ncbi:peptidylprolyl isomerase [filamentous cyanobacterium LEGE 11480]|uniref:peptidylprolyl isomerase n=1 Tax=Romeriopsis navalis LEGE 11480 TaxID=2777977 RepID=A0A928VGT3_9CYAN|nr:peptidylprolyl isomerase [Romeriopsis navalis LEGE 11480]
MESKAFLTVDDGELSIRDCLRYLQSGNKLQQFIADVLRQYVLEQELTTREDLEIDDAAVQQAVIDFRIQQDLTDPPAFQEFLKKNGMDAIAFQKQITNNFKLEKLKAIVSGERLQEYFIERKVFLDRVILSRIIVESQDMAEELKVQVQEGGSFEALAQEHSITDDRMVNGMMGPVSRGTLPDEIRAKIDAAEVGDIVGPLELENRWGLFRVEKQLDATLDDQQLQQTLKGELFERWLSEKIQKMSVRLQVPE